MADVAVKFRVQGEVTFGASMFVVGDCPTLGAWNADNSTELQQVELSDQKSVWEGVVVFPPNKDIYYRFFIGKIITYATGPEVEVLWWETNVQPRYLRVPEQENSELPTAEFGTYDGTRAVSNGWLEHQACLQLRFHSDPIFMWNAKHREETYSIKCSPLDYEPGSMPDVLTAEDSESMDGPPPCARTLVFFHNLNTTDLVPSRQPRHGCIYNRGGYLVFTARGANQTHLGFQLDLFVHQKDSDAKYIGSAHLLPTPKLNASIIVKKVPIIGLKHRPIGELSVEVLHIYPTPGYTCMMDVSYQNHWKWRENGSTLNIGHRGMGSSYHVKRLAMATENTIFSLHSAAANGADFVEFDVLLSKDLVPVIYHDFSICISYAQKGRDSRELLEIPVKDLKLDHLQSMKLYHTSSKPDSQIDLSHDLDDEDKQPFPTLKSCLERVDKNVGFNIEIKYPLTLETGESEMDNYFDLNPYIDQILNVVLQHAGDRKIIFSTFHPDSCLMVQLKQNKYPVLLLSNGPTKRYTPYKDWRCTSFQNGINFAKAEGILGVNFQAEGLIQDLPIIKYIQSLGLVLFVWGEDLSDAKVKDRLRKEGVDGLIFDRIEKKPEEFEVETETEFQEVLELAHFVSATPCDNSHAAHTSSCLSLSVTQANSNPSTSVESSV